MIKQHYTKHQGRIWITFI